MFRAINLPHTSRFFVTTNRVGGLRAESSKLKMAPFLHTWLSWHFLIGWGAQTSWHGPKRHCEYVLSPTENRIVCRIPIIFNPGKKIFLSARSVLTSNSPFHTQPLCPDSLNGNYAYRLRRRIYILVYILVRDWRRSCFVIGFKNTRDSPSTRYRVSVWIYFFPLGEWILKKIPGFAAKLPDPLAGSGEKKLQILKYPVNCGRGIRERL